MSSKADGKKPADEATNAAGSSGVAEEVAEGEREKSLSELLLLMNTYKPVIPDAVTDHYLAQSGFQTADVRVRRILALAAQKFIADVAADAYRYARVRPQSVAARRSGKDKRTVLTNDDLAAALNEYGVNVRKPDYYQ